MYEILVSAHEHDVRDHASAAETQQARQVNIGSLTDLRVLAKRLLQAFRQLGWTWRYLVL